MPPCQFSKDHMTFQELGLPESICLALSQAELTIPTAVQEKAIPFALEGKDLISSARTGSGKTLAYSLPMITRLAANERATALVLVPTREIGVQVQSVLQPYLKALKMQAPLLIIGGVSYGPQIQGLKRQPQVIIATPGRLNDHLKTSKLRLDHVRILVLDEADRMLDMGFLPQVKQILKHLSSDRQTMLFSATMPSDLKKVCQDILRDPEQVAVDSPNVANVDIKQLMIEIDGDGKNDALLTAVNSKTESVLVFARTKRRTDKVAQFLAGFGVNVDRIHGDRSQAQRQKAIDSFRTGRIKVLVATDIAARGLDIPLVELVVNFDLPDAKEDYVHRIGRTGRAGAQGEALSFVASNERGQWGYLTGVKGAKQMPHPRPQNTRGGGRRPENRRPEGGRRPEGRRDFRSDSSRQTDFRAPQAEPRDDFAEKRPFENRRPEGERRPEGRPFERSSRPFGDRKQEPRNFDRNPRPFGNRESEGSRPEGRSFDRSPRPFGDRRPDGGRRPEGRSFDRSPRPFENKRPSERSNESHAPRGGERREFADRNEPRPFREGRPQKRAFRDDNKPKYDGTQRNKREPVSPATSW